MNPAVPLLILGHAPGTQAVEVVPRDELERIEARWSARFVAVPKGAAPLTFPDYSREIVAEVERLLERARTEGAALAEDEARTALTEVERLLHAHPELPQAAWLMAERHQLAASLAESTRASDSAELRQRARALEPERAATFGQDPSSLVPDLPAFRLDIRGPLRRDQLEWDGAERAFPADVHAGEHQLRVLRDGELIWAGWVAVGSTQPVLELDATRVLACSAADLGATRDAATGPEAPADVGCPAWAVLRITRGRPEIAMCRRSRCGGWYAAAPLVKPAATGPRPAAGGLPRWAGYAIAGAGAALITGVTLWQLGAFDRDRAGEQRWVYEGYVPP